MKRIEILASTVFGGIFLALSFLVATETLLRKIFNFSLQGADELGGYALAVGATIAFSVGVFGRSHMRIDIFHELLPRRFQTLLNWLSAVLLGGFALLLAWICLQVINETLEFGSTAQTPWATPLIYPQSVWLGGLVLFALVALGFAGRATYLLVSGKHERLNVEFHPKGVNEELKEELEDYEQRAQSESNARTDVTPEYGAATATTQSAGEVAK